MISLHGILIYHYPDSKVHGAHLGPTGPRWAPCWPHELCYLGHNTKHHISLILKWLISRVACWLTVMGACMCMCMCMCMQSYERNAFNKITSSPVTFINALYFTSVLARELGPRFNIKTVFPGMMIAKYNEIIRLWDRLIFVMKSMYW